MSYWIGLSEEEKLKYKEEFKKRAYFNEFFNAFKVVQCRNCDQIIVMKLIKDSLSNSSGLVYAGECINGHWNQVIPSVPWDVRRIPKCNLCKSYKQYKLSKDFNGWFCKECGK